MPTTRRTHEPTPPTSGAPTLDAADPPPPPPSGAPTLDTLFLRRLWRLVKIAAAREGSRLTLSTNASTANYKDHDDCAAPGVAVGPSAAPAGVLLLAIALVAEVLVYVTGTLTSRFYPTLQDKDLDGFLSVLGRAIATYGTLGCVNGAMAYFAGVFAVRFRSRLLRALQRAYVRGGNVLVEVARRSAVAPLPLAPPAPVDAAGRGTGSGLRRRRSTARSGWAARALRTLRRPRTSGEGLLANVEEAAGEETVGEGAGSLVVLDEDIHRHPHLHQRHGHAAETARVGPLALDEVAAPAVDNPDQTITQDVDKLADQIKEVMYTMVLDPIMVVYYSYQTVAVSGTVLAPAIVLAYFLVSTSVVQLFMRPLVRLTYRKERAEGDLRSLHARLREWAEAVGFASGERAEAHRLDGTAARVLFAQRRVLNRSSVLFAVTETVGYYGAILAYAIIAIPVFSGAFDGLPGSEVAGIIAKNVFFTIYLIF
ncbi:hypothetical protein HK405_003259, partial [Cladochytrium tenue]